MERKINNDLFKWSKDQNKKPMLLYGITGCGKTYTCLEFGEKEYKNTIYFDCNNNLELIYVFSKNNTLEKVVRGLAAISLQTIMPEESLVIFDNVDEKILDYVKKIFINTQYHIIMITNSKKLFNKKYMEFSLKIMNLVSFPEYLKFIGKDQLITFIEESYATSQPMPFHSLAFEYFNDYIITGGYPESIVKYVENKKTNILSIYNKTNISNLKNYLFELDNLIDIKRGLEVFDNIPYQLIKDNKKFQYGLLRTGGRAKEYENAIDFLVDHDILYKSSKLKEVKMPLNKNKDEESFKLYYNDSGILCKKFNVAYEKILNDERLLNVLYENHIANCLKTNEFNLYYYQSTGKSEVDFIIQTRNGKIIPIELVVSKISKSKSLALIMNKFNLDSAIRIGRDNFYTKRGVKYIPYYATFCIKEIK